MLNNKSIGLMILGALIGYSVNGLTGAFIGALAGLAASFLR